MNEPEHAKPNAEKWTEQRVLDIRPWAPGLFSFYTSRASDFSFSPGQFARLGLADAKGEILARAYSIVSAPVQRFLEFYAVLIPGGDFSECLERLRPGQSVRVDRDSYGFLTADSFADGTDLWLLASGTGLAPFVSMLRDGRLWQRFPKVIAVHSVRTKAELAYRDELEALCRRYPLRYLPVTTREKTAGALDARIPRLIEDGRLEAAAGTGLAAERSRLMICGNPQMCADMRQLLNARGFRVNRRLKPGQMIFENYW